METKNLQTEIMAIVTEITKSKEKAKRVPTYATSIDVWKQLSNATTITLDEFKTAVNELVKAGKLDHGRTVNNVYLKIKE